MINGVEQTRLSRQHYWLAAVTLYFNRDGANTTGEVVFENMTMNVLVSNAKQQIAMHQIGQIKNGAITRLKAMLEGTDVEIGDAVIVSLPYLGHFTQQEFAKMPNATLSAPGHA